MPLYGLIGYPLGHSFSAGFFRQKWARQKLTGFSYELFPLQQIGELPYLLRTHPDLCGFNVTIPFKRAIIPLLDSLSIEAKAVEAVNTVRVTRYSEHYTLEGHNTDIDGIAGVIGRLRKVPEAALILGNGGAAAALRYVLKNNRIPFTVVSRQPSEGVISYESVTDEIIGSHPLIVNCTPIGTAGFEQERHKIPFEAVGEGHTLFDMTYNPAVTSFMKEGLKRGAVAVNGYPMLTVQAEKAWAIWEPTLAFPGQSR